MGALVAGDVVSPFSGVEAFEAAQRMARALSMSSMVPDGFRARAGDGGAAVANVLVAMQLAARLKLDLFMVMQNVFVVRGKVSFSAQFVIALVNGCGRFGPLQFEFVRGGDGVAEGCRAFADDLRFGVRLDGAVVSMEMVSREGWSGREGSKWRSMPEQMLMYRAAVLWARVYAPDVMLGLDVSGSGEVVADDDVGGGSIAVAEGAVAECPDGSDGEGAVDG